MTNFVTRKTVVAVIALGVGPLWGQGVGELPAQDVISIPHDRARVTTDAFYPIFSEIGDVYDILIEIDDPGVATVAGPSQFQVTVPYTLLDSSSEISPNNRRVSSPFTVAAVQCGQTGYTVTMTDENGMVFQGRGVIRVGVKLNPRVLMLFPLEVGTVTAASFGSSPILLDGIRGRCVPNIAEILPNADVNTFNVKAGLEIGTTTCRIQASPFGGGFTYYKDLEVQIVDRLDVDLWPKPGLYLGADWKQEVLQGPGGALEYHGFKAEHFPFSLNSEDGTTFELRLPGMEMQAPCNRNRYMLTCSNSYVQATITRQPGPNLAVFDIAAPAGMGMTIERVSGMFDSLGTKQDLAPRARRSSVDKDGDVLDVIISNLTGGKVRSTEKLLVVTLTPRLVGPAEQEIGSAMKVQQTTDEFLTSELTLLGPDVVRVLIPPNEDPGMREFVIESDSGDVTIMQEGADSTRPVIAAGGLLEGAAFTPGIVSGGWASFLGDFFIEGVRTWGGDDFTATAPLLESGRVAQGATFLPVALDGVSVTVGGKPAFVQFISKNQINVLIADDETLGPVEVVVTTPSGVSFLKPATKVAFHPQFFRFGPEGRVHVAGVHLDGTFLGPADLFGGAVATRPARPGDTVQLFGTGWGPTDPPTPTAQLVSGAVVLANPVTVRVGGVEATVQFAGLVASGLNQINVVIPDLPPGQYMLDADVAGVPMSVVAAIAVE